MNVPSVFGVLFFLSIWLYKDALKRRGGSQPFSRAYRWLLWLAAAVWGLIGVVFVGVASYYAFKPRGNLGFGGILVFLLPLIGLPALIAAYLFAWIVRHPPGPPKIPQQSTAADAASRNG